MSASRGVAPNPGADVAAREAAPGNEALSRFLTASARWLRADRVRLLTAGDPSADADPGLTAARAWRDKGADPEQNGAVVGDQRIEFVAVPAGDPAVDDSAAGQPTVLVVQRPVRRPRPARQAERITAVAALAGQLLTGEPATRTPRAARIDVADGEDPEAVARGRLAAHLDRAGAGAVFVVGVDRLAVVNEVFGREGGDEVLAALSDRLASWAGPNAGLARLSGTRLGVARTDLIDADAAVRAADDLRDILAAPVAVHGLSVSRSVSVGVAVGGGTRGADVVVQAVRGSLAARESGGDAVRSYDADLAEERLARLRLELELDDALRTDQLRLFYQPEFDLPTGRLLAVEALLRWEHPRLGLVRADAFIEDTERTRTFADVQMWVIEQACAQLAAWQARPGAQGLAVRINVSAWQIGRGDIAERLLTCIERHGIRPETVCVELTERRMPRRPDRIVEPLTRLAAAGVSLAIDDFGTGQGTIAQLTTLPVDTVKIDQSFVTAMRTDERADTIVGGVIALASSLSLDTVAEGVDGADTAARLVELGCTRGQGNSLGAAMPPGELEALLSRR